MGPPILRDGRVPRPPQDEAGKCHHATTTSISPTRFLVGFTVIRTSCPSAVGNSISRPTEKLLARPAHRRRIILRHSWAKSGHDGIAASQHIPPPINLLPYRFSGGAETGHKMKTGTFLIAILALSLAAASPARAACDPFAKAHKLYVAELNAALKAYDRVKAMKPKPRTDAAYCRALRKVLRDTPYIVTTADRSCFQTDRQLQDFKTNVKKLGLTSQQWPDSTAPTRN
jgi:hypothetical protein